MTEDERMNDKIEKFMEEASRHIVTINKKDFLDICTEEAYELCTGCGEYEPNEIVKRLLATYSVGVAKRMFSEPND